MSARPGRIWPLLAVGWTMALGTADAFAQGSAPMSHSEAHRYFSSKTRVSLDQGHGTQVSFTSADGRVFLWYPGNAVVLHGRWRIVDAQGGAAICFLYGSNTYNPVTQQAGGRWSCGPADRLKRITVDQANGDVFGLARRRTVPFRLSSERTTIAELQRALGRQGPGARRTKAP